MLYMQSACLDSRKQDRIISMVYLMVKIFDLILRIFNLTESLTCVPHYVWE